MMNDGIKIAQAKQASAATVFTGEALGGRFDGANFFGIGFQTGPAMMELMALRPAAARKLIEGLLVTFSKLDIDNASDYREALAIIERLNDASSTSEDYGLFDPE